MIVLSVQNTWLGFTEGFWGAIIGASIPVLVGIVGVVIKWRGEKKNRNVRTFSKINYELKKFIKMVNQLEYQEEEIALLLEKKCINLVNRLSEYNVDTLDAKEILVFYEILNIIDEIGDNSYLEEDVRDDHGRLEGSISHANPNQTTKQIGVLEQKRKELIKNYSL